MALTNFWMELTSCLAVMLIYCGALLEAITQLIKEVFGLMAPRQTQSFLAMRTN